MPNVDILMGSRLTFSNSAPLQIRPRQVDDALQDGTAAGSIFAHLMLVHAYMPGYLSAELSHQLLSILHEIAETVMHKITTIRSAFTWQSAADRKFSISKILGCKLMRMIWESVLAIMPGTGRAVCICTDCNLSSISA